MASFFSPFYGSLLTPWRPSKQIYQQISLGDLSYCQQKTVAFLNSLYSFTNSRKTTNNECWIKWIDKVRTHGQSLFFMRNLTNVPQDTVILTKQTGKFSEMEMQIENKHGDGRIYRPSFLKPRERSKTTYRAHETVNHLVQRISEVHFVIPMHMDMFRGKYALTTNKLISLFWWQRSAEISLEHHVL